MKKAVLVLVAVATLGCNKQEENCTQKVYKKTYNENGIKWVLINEGSWSGPDQYKNYTRTIRYQDGSFDVIKQVVICD